jgi:anti-sigma factor (TIGR02949 family)
MSDCGCEKAKSELEEYLHQELSEQDFQDISEHLAGCDDCSTEHLVGLTLTEKMRKACKEQAPAELREAVALKLRTLSAQQ